MQSYDGCLLFIQFFLMKQTKIFHKSNTMAKQEKEAIF